MHARKIDKKISNILQHSKLWTSACFKHLEYFEVSKSFTKIRWAKVFQLAE